MNINNITRLNCTCIGKYYHNILILHQNENTMYGRLRTTACYTSYTLSIINETLVYYNIIINSNTFKNLILLTIV